MAATLPTEGIDFPYLLLEYYKKLGLSEKEVAVLFMINHLNNQKNDVVTPDMLSMKMNLSTNEADGVLSNLVSRKFVEFVADKSKPSSPWRTSLEPLMKVLWKHFSADVARANQNRYDAERAKDLEEVYAVFEKKLRKTLSPFDKDAINGWLDDGYRPIQIKDAMEDCLLEGKKSMKAIAKRLRVLRAGEDIRKEGVTAVSDKWDKDIEETLRIANFNWVPTDEGGR